MTGRIDVHSHLLPGVDDGCESLEESIACAKALVSAGYTHSFCTPHVLSKMDAQTNEVIARWTEALQSQLAAAGVELTLMPGGEINLWPDLIQTMTPNRLATFGGHGKYCLVDLWADKLPDVFAPTVKWLQDQGLKVILAHPERMKAVQLKPELADYFAELGLLLQGNLQCFSDMPASPTRTVAERYLREGRYFILGSDLHKMKSLPARLAGLQFAIDLAGKAAINRLTVENPRMLFE